MGGGGGECRRGPIAWPHRGWRPCVGNMRACFSVGKNYFAVAFCLVIKGLSTSNLVLLPEIVKYRKFKSK